MRRIYSFTIVFLLVFLMSAGVSFAGAWTKEKGEFYAETLFTHYQTDREFDKHHHLNNFSNGGHFRKEEWSAYFEYGLLERLTLVGQTAYDYIRYTDTQTALHNYGFATNELGLRYCGATEPVVFSLQQIVAVPSRFRENPEFPITNAQVDLESRVLLGKYWERAKIYVNLEAGIRFRLDEPADEFRTQFLIGYKGIKRTELTLQVDGTTSFNNGEELRIPSSNITRTLEYDLYRLAATALVDITRNVRVKVQPFWHFAGDNTGEGWGVTSGFVFNFGREK